MPSARAKLTYAVWPVYLAPTRFPSDTQLCLKVSIENQSISVPLLTGRGDLVPGLSLKVLHDHLDIVEDEAIGPGDRIVQAFV
jgi:hypothetical protein